MLDLIVSGAFDRHSPLSERGLADSLGLSRTPVREALRELARDGLLEAVPARGTFVRVLMIDDLRELYEVRYGLEGVGATLAASYGPSEDLLAYAPVLRRLLETDADPAEAYDVGARFHLDVMACARNRLLLDIYEPMRLRAQLALGLPRTYDHARVRESVSEHLAILDAVEARDGERAQSLIVEHLARGLDARLKIFSRFKAGAAAGGKPA
ncbi:MAG: FCD domain-containing protein [Betaproteobacteria bacterium]|nr:FCD domain-containing protein [Betaproteobacteria bacterium]